MTTLTDTAPLDVDLDAQVPCTTSLANCPFPAAWKVLHPCCGLHRTHCNFHREMTERSWDQIHAEMGRVRCAACDTVPMPRPSWRPL